MCQQKTVKMYLKGASVRCARHCKNRWHVTELSRQSSSSVYQEETGQNPRTVTKGEIINLMRSDNVFVHLFESRCVVPIIDFFIV